MEAQVHLHNPPLQNLGSHDPPNPPVLMPLPENYVITVEYAHNLLLSNLQLTYSILKLLLIAKQKVCCYYVLLLNKAKTGVTTLPMI